MTVYQESADGREITQAIKDIRARLKQLEKFDAGQKERTVVTVVAAKDQAIAAKGQAEAAEVKADDAQSVADSAATLAQAAYDRPTTEILTSTNAPTAADEASDGSVWWTVDSNDSIIQQFQRIAGEWVQQEFTSSLIAETLVGKTIVGSTIEGAVITADTSLTGASLKVTSGNILVEQPANSQVPATLTLRDSNPQINAYSRLTRAGLSINVNAPTQTSDAYLGAVTGPIENGVQDLEMGLQWRFNGSAYRTLSIRASDGRTFVPGAIMATRILSHQGQPLMAQSPVNSARPTSNYNYSTPNNVIEWGTNLVARPARAVNTQQTRQRFTCTQAGVYEVNMTMRSFHQSGTIIAQLRKNGGAIVSPTANPGQILNLPGYPVPLVVGDYLDVFVNTNFAGGLASEMYIDSNASYLSVTMLAEL